MGAPIKFSPTVFIIRRSACNSYYLCQHTIVENCIGAPKMQNNIGAIKLVILTIAIAVYVEHFFIAPCEVIALDLLCFFVALSIVLALLTIAIVLVISLSRS